ncbi:MAG: hypothetical protein AAGN35_12860 [Bacteroidota bacterium]
MKSFLIKVLAFGALFFVLDKSAYFILQNSVKYISGYDPRIQRIMDGQMNKEVIVLGSSRGAKSVVAEQIQAETGRSSYNLCVNSSDVSFHEYQLRSLLRYNTAPKVLLYVLDDPIHLQEQNNYSFRTDLLAPLAVYYQCNEGLIQAGVHSPVSRYLWITRLGPNHFSPEWRSTDPFDTVRACGTQWLNYYSDWRDFPYQEQYYNARKDVAWKVESLKKIATHCREYGIRFVLVYPPNYRPHSREFEAKLRQVLGPEVEHLVYNQDNPAYRDRQYFYDPDHLHLSGGRLFTEEIIERLGL